jgi:isoleucyl-tRNA synthetase
MSKSKGNTLDPLEFANEFGADTLRLWVAAGDYNQDLRASQGSLDQAKGDYRKLRGLLRFCLANLFDFNFDVYQGHHPLVQEVAEYKSNVNKAYERYEFNKAYRLTMDFVAHVSSAYLGSETEGMKGDLYLAYEGDHSNPLRREAQVALSYLLLTLLQTLEPMTPHLVSEVQAFQTFTVPQEKLSLRDLKKTSFEPLRGLKGAGIDAVSARAHAIAEENRTIRIKEDGTREKGTTVVVAIPRTEECRGLLRNLSSLLGVNTRTILYCSIHVGLTILEQNNIKYQPFNNDMCQYHIELPYATYEELKKQELLDSATEIAMLGIKTLASRLEDVITKPQKDK